MSKFLKALEQAERDRNRARAGETSADPGAVPTPTVREGATVRVLSETDEIPAADATPRRTRIEAVHGIDPRLVSLTAPEGFEAEQYRSLRTSLEIWKGDGACRVIGISSPAAGDGKTTTAINLAATLTQGGDARVLLIEADLRNPMVADDLGMRRDGGHGLVEWLRDAGQSPHEIVSRRPPFRFDLVLAGRRIASPYELLKSPQLKELIDDVRGRYDYVLLDTPPLVSLADCQVLANWIDGFLIVVAAHRTPRRLVEEALGVVGPEKVIGFVFNQDDRSLAGYGYYYGYHRRP